MAQDMQDAGNVSAELDAMVCDLIGFCLYTLCAVSVRAEGTFGRLRYILGGDRPSQTPHLTLSPSRVTAAG